MHITIAGAEEMVEVKGKREGQPLKYTAYHVHINGTYHCSVRYSTLSTLHNTLKREYGAEAVGDFPPKKFFHVSPEASEERRMQLQRFLQKVSQNPAIATGATFQTFLLNAQAEVQRGPEEEVQLEIYLCNGKSTTVDILSTHQTDDVLETAASVINIPPDLTYFFGLYLVEDPSGKEVVRRLQEFESPYISLLRAREPEGSQQCIMLARAYWDVRMDGILAGNPVTLNLLYMQAINDVKNGWIVVDPKLNEALAALRSNREYEKFFRILRTQRGYGIHMFGPAVLHYPKDDNKVTLGLGLGFLLAFCEAGAVLRFNVQRIRCWRTYNTDDGVEMEFEYYFEPSEEHPEGKMRWIRLCSKHVIHVAMCLQSFVEELLRLRSRKPIKRPADRVGKFKPRRQNSESRDLSFIGSDSAASSAPSTPAPSSPAPASPPLSASSNKAKPKLSITLSDLMARISAEDQEEKEEQLDFAALSRITDEERKESKYLLPSSPTGLKALPSALLASSSSDPANAGSSRGAAAEAGVSGGAAASKSSASARASRADEDDESDDEDKKMFAQLASL